MMAVRQAGDYDMSVSTRRIKNYSASLNKKAGSEPWCGGDRSPWWTVRGVRDVYPTGYHNLPVRVLSLIFRPFDERELRTRLARVCRKWRRVALARVPEARGRELRFGPRAPPAHFMCREIRTHAAIAEHLLQTVRLCNVPDAVTVIRQLCRCAPRITCVGVRECEPVPESSLRHLVASCRLLREIDLKGTHFAGGLFYVEAAVLPDLRAIDLSNSRHVTGSNLLELVLNCRTLERLRLTHRHQEQQLGTRDVACLLMNLATRLTALAFDGSGQPDATYRSLAACHNLERLALHNATGMSAESLLAVGDNMPHLERLKLRGLTVEPPVYVALFERGTLNRLTSVDLANCRRFDDRGLEALCRRCGLRLVSVSIKNCVEVRSLKPLIRHRCVALRHINVAFCVRVPDEDLDSLTEQLTQLVRLTVDMPSPGELRRRTLADIAVRHPRVNIQICLSEFDKKCMPFNLKDSSVTCRI